MQVEEPGSPVRNSVVHAVAVSPQRNYIQSAESSNKYKLKKEVINKLLELEKDCSFWENVNKYIDLLTQ